MGKFLLLIAIAAAVAYFSPAPVLEHEASVQIDAPRERVWEVMGDLSRIPRWNGAATEVDFEGSKRQGVGTVLDIGGRPIRYVLEVERWEPYNRIDYRVLAEPRATVDHVLRYSIRPRYGRTVVHMSEQYRMRGGYLGYAFGRLLYDRMGSELRAPALANLKRLVETGVGLGLS